MDTEIEAQRARGFCEIRGRTADAVVLFTITVVRNLSTKILTSFSLYLISFINNVIVNGYGYIFKIND